jgi:bacterioferritin-associated ferredoxin
MYVCLCQSVTDKEIRRAAARGVSSLEQLREELGVASCCGCCAPTAEAVLAEASGAPAPLTVNAGWFPQPARAGGV